MSILGDRAQCKFCHKWLHRRGLKRHIKEVHEHEGASDGSQLVCHLCDKNFKNEQSLKNHLRAFHNIYQQQL